MITYYVSAVDGWKGVPAENKTQKKISIWEKKEGKITVRIQYKCDIYNQSTFLTSICTWV